MFWMVTLNGSPLRRRMTKRDAEAMAERWQGERYRKGLLKHADKGDHVEVKEDVASILEFNEQYGRFKEGLPQRDVEYIGGE